MSKRTNFSLTSLVFLLFVFAFCSESHAQNSYFKIHIIGTSAQQSTPEGAVAVSEAAYAFVADFIVSTHQAAGFEHLITDAPETTVEENLDGTFSAVSTGYIYFVDKDVQENGEPLSSYRPAWEFDFEWGR